MKTKWTLSLILLVSIFFSTNLMGQSDPFGIQDTLTVSNTSSPRNGKVYVDINLNNDEPLYGFSVPLRFSPAYISCDTILFNNTKLENISVTQFMIDNQEGYVLFGGLVLIEEEEPLATGPGKLARLVFDISPDAPVGLETAIDSGFVPPAGEMVLTGANAQEIFPVFNSGIITVDDDNYPPVFNELPRQYVVEGDTLSFRVEAYDRELDDYRITATRLPEGAEFSSQDNTFTWVPDFVGPNSSIGNPHEVVFVASDSFSSSHMKVEIEVINKNRDPVISVVDGYEGDAGDTVEILVAAEDPDFENVTISASNLPQGCTYNNENPGVISWESAYSDSGSYLISLEAADESGAVVTKDVNLTLHAVAICDLALGEVQGYVGSTQIIPVNLLNRTAIKSMQLLIKYDPTALQMISISNGGTRTDNWEKFNVTHDAFSGRIWVVGEADAVGGTSVDPLPVGDGEILNLEFQATSNLDYAGIFVDVVFEFLDQLTYKDNTFVDENDQLIPQDDISYTNGSFFIKLYEGLIGDINLNGIAFEISDLIYFNNHFIDPNNYPLDGEKLQNSDINQDGRPGTLGDLVYFIRIVTGDADPPGKMQSADNGLAANVKVRSYPNRISIHSDWDQEIGAAVFTFACEGEKPDIYQTERTTGLKQSSSYQDGILRVLICDPSGMAIRAGDGPLLELGVSDPEAVQLQSAELADIHGMDISTKISSAATVPEKFALGQNYPNPFNPTTTISLALPVESRVSLKIYNIMGQVVRTLLDEVMPAGYHEITWNGTDQNGNQVSSGVYFYKLQSDNFSETKKMIMLK
jgi:hypothetical protein